MVKVNQTRLFLYRFLTALIAAFIFIATPVSAADQALINILNDAELDMKGEASILYYDETDGGSYFCSAPSNISTTSDGSNLTIIGDSYTQGAKSYLLKSFKNLTDADINFRVGRPWSEGVKIASESTLKEIVIFALGTNNTDGIKQKDIDNALAAIGPDKTIIFTTARTLNETYNAPNELLRSNAASNSNIIIADWAKAIDGQESTYISATDRIHPNAKGYELFTKLLYEAANSGAADAANTDSALNGATDGSSEPNLSEDTRTSTGSNTDYAGNKILPDELMTKIEENRHFY